MFYDRDIVVFYRRISCSRRCNPPSTSPLSFRIQLLRTSLLNDSIMNPFSNSCYGACDVEIVYFAVQRAVKQSYAEIDQVLKTTLINSELIALARGLLAIWKFPVNQWGQKCSKFNERLIVGSLIFRSKFKSADPNFVISPKLASAIQSHEIKIFNFRGTSRVLKLSNSLGDCRAR